MRVSIWSSFAGRTWEGEVGDDLLLPLEEKDASINEALFRLFNRVDPEDGARLEDWGYRLPSLSVGDRLTYGGRTFIVMPVGFHETAEPLPPCSCTWADDGDGESGPSPYIAEADPSCLRHHNADQRPVTGRPGRGRRPAMSFEILLGKTGARAEAETLAGALLAASTLVDDYAEAQGSQGARRAARESVTITEDGAYAGTATVLAQEGRRLP